MGHTAVGPRGLGNEVRQRIREDGISLTLVTDGCNMGQCVDVNPARQVESRIPWLASVSRRGPREGTTRGGLVRETHPVAVDLPSRVLAPDCKTSAEKKRVTWAVRPEKGNLLKGGRDGDWPLRRASVLPF